MNPSTRAAVTASPERFHRAVHDAPARAAAAIHDLAFEVAARHLARGVELAVAEIGGSEQAHGRKRLQKVRLVRVRAGAGHCLAHEPERIAGAHRAGVLVLVPDTGDSMAAQHLVAVNLLRVVDAAAELADPGRGDAHRT